MKINELIDKNKELLVNIKDYISGVKEYFDEHKGKKLKEILPDLVKLSEYATIIAFDEYYNEVIIYDFDINYDLDFENGIIVKGFVANEEDYIDFSILGKEIFIYIDLKNVKKMEESYEL